MSNKDLNPQRAYRQEAAESLYGLLLLIQKRPEGAWFFYQPVTKIWGSFRAYLWCLPVQCFSWSLIWSVNFQDNQSYSISRLDFMLTNGLVDLLAWFSFAAIIVLVIGLTTKDRHFAPVIIGTNWFNLMAVYIFFIPTGLQFLVPASIEFGWVLDLLTLALVLGLYFRVVKQLTGGHSLLAFALTLLNISVGIILSQMMYDAILV